MDKIFFIGIIIGILSRLIMLHLDQKQYPTEPNILLSQLVLAFVASALGSLLVPALIERSYTSITFLSLAAQQFRQVRDNRRDTLQNLEDVQLIQRGNAFIELDWMFSDLLERKYVKQAIANIMQKNNPTYKQNCKYKNNKNPEDIDGFSIVRKKGKIILRFSGNDNYTIVDLYGNENEQYNEKSALNKINFTQLNDEIMNVITKENKVNDAGAKLIIAGIEQAENEAFGNLIEYYKYLIDEKEQSKKHTCTITQRVDEIERKTQNTHDKRNKYERKNEIIDFQKRRKMLEENKPKGKVEVVENLEDGTQEMSYISFVYKNLLNDINCNQNGYLFVCEPVSGDRNTRVFYLDEGSFEKFEKDKKQDRLSAVTKKYLEMSNEEFKEEERCLTLTHTSLETYKERLNFFINGQKGKSLTNLKEYQQKLKDLYGDEQVSLPYYKPKNIFDIEIIVDKANGIDRTAQKELAKYSRGEVYVK